MIKTQKLNYRILIRFLKRSFRIYQQSDLDIGKPSFFRNNSCYFSIAVIIYKRNFVKQILP
ncbi:MAG: hypothetical protein COA57_09160 [Flavobacteriales bacterium]|nr:MAG: hypothetical protein COA57_09160 [Flavobacteriales bacterium]